MSGGAGFIRNPFPSSVPIWQGHGKDIQLAQGGFALGATGLPSGTIIPAGTPMIYDEAARTAIIGSGGGTLEAAAAANPVTYRLNKGSTIKVGDNIALTIGGDAHPVTAIDTSNAAYDVYTVGTTIGNAAVGASVYVSSAAGVAAGVYPTTINGLLYEDSQVPVSGQTTTVSVVIRGTVYARRIPYVVTGGLAAISGLDDINFSQSK